MLYMQKILLPLFTTGIFFMVWTSVSKIFIS